MSDSEMAALATRVQQAVDEITAVVRNTSELLWKLAALCARWKDELGEYWATALELVAKRTLIDESTLDNYAYLYRQAERDGWLVRDQHLTLGHHNALLHRSLAPSERRAILVVAAEKQWSVRQLREYVHDLLERRQEEEPPALPDGRKRDWRRGADRDFIPRPRWENLEGQQGTIVRVNDVMWLQIGESFFLLQRLRGRERK